MHTKIKLFVVLSALLLTMCTVYDQAGAVVSSNGLSCQTHTDFGAFERQGDKNRFFIVKQAAECSYQCPDRKIREFELPGKFSASSPLYSASKEELNSRYCGIALQPTPTQLSATVSPTSTVFPTESPTEQAFTSPLAETSTAVEPPLLRGEVTMCDLAVNLINFRLVESVPDLTGKTLAVQIADQESTCAVNPSNTSLLTCTIPASVNFPARVVVRLDGAVMNDFTFDGRGCAKIATPFPTTTP
jgi:hypothetical protein